MKLGLIVCALFIGGLLQVAAEEKGWTVSATDYKAPYVGAPVANGGIGILPWKEPFSVKQVILNHVFEKGSKTGVSRVLKGLNPFCLDLFINGRQVTGDGLENWSQQIDMRRAVHTTSFSLPKQAEVTYTVRALRNMPYTGMIQVKVKALQSFFLQVSQHTDVPKGYAAPEVSFSKVRGGKNSPYLMNVTAATSGGSHTVSAASYLSYEKAAFQSLVHKDTHRLSIERMLQPGEEVAFTLWGSVCSTRDYEDVYNEANRQIVYANYVGAPALIAAHEKAWNALWKGDIVIEGDDEAQTNVRFALYNLYAFGREGSRLSIPPMGLSAQGYNGHIFWDAELWMYPPLLLLNPGIARSMMDYRIDRLKGARQRAYAYGYQGVMFPWESDDSGTEATPTWALTGPFEHHVTADVAIAAWQYYCVTKDKTWLQNEGYPLLKAVADFWVSRVEQNSDGSYSVVNVVGANEYASGVTDNAFTNGAAVCALRYAMAAAKACREPVPQEWAKIARGLSFHYLDDGVTKEHKHYQGAMIKQADVNLLGYPLELVTDPKQLKRDMEYYMDKIDPKHGPAMSYSVFCVQYARLGEADKAYQMFERCYKPNWREPFGVLAETPTSQNPYFATGAGGLLQAVINGFGGLSISEKGIVQKPSVLPAHWKKLVIKGVGPEGKTYVRNGK